MKEGHGRNHRKQQASKKRKKVSTERATEGGQPSLEGYIDAEDGDTHDLNGCQYT
jgi:hypothetical protein